MKRLPSLHHATAVQISAIMLTLSGALLCVACVVEGPNPTKPSPVPPSRPEIATPTTSATSAGPDGEASTIQGGKACVLTPADPTLIPVCNYTCPNGITFSLPNVGYPVSVCSRVAPQPKKN